MNLKLSLGYESSLRFTFNLTVFASSQQHERTLDFSKAGSAALEDGSVGQYDMNMLN